MCGDSTICYFHEELDEEMSRHAVHLLFHLTVSGVLGSAVTTDFSVTCPSRQGKGSGENKKPTGTVMALDFSFKKGSYRELILSL